MNMTSLWFRQSLEFHQRFKVQYCNDLIMYSLPSEATNSKLQCGYEWHMSIGRSSNITVYSYVDATTLWGRGDYRVNFTAEQAMKASRREYRYSSTLPLTSVLGGGSPHFGRFSPRERSTIPIVHEAGWAPVLFWMGAENLAPTGIRSQDRSARSE